MSIEEIYSRRSIRKFKDIPVETEHIYKILNAGIAAPSAKNRQPWKYIVFTGSKKNGLLNAMEKGLIREKNEIARMPKSSYGLADAFNTLRIMKSAPVIVITLNTNGSSPFIPIDSDEHIVEICDTLSIGASIENILLTAQSLGLGSLWIANTFFAYTELTEYLDTTHQLVCAIALGYADEKPHSRPRKDFEEIAEFRQ